MKKILLVLCVVAAVATAYVLLSDQSGNTSVIPKGSMQTGVQERKEISEDKTQQQAQNQTQPQAQQPAQSQPITNQNNNNKTMTLDIKTTTQGTGDRAVKAGDTVSVLYTGKLLDGTVFDASVKHGNQPFDFMVGAGMVIKGWDQGLLGAKVGEKRTLTIPGDLAYGPQGIPGTIPPNATLIFDVEVVSIK